MAAGGDRLDFWATATDRELFFADGRGIGSPRPGHLGRVRPGLDHRRGRSGQRCRAARARHGRRLAGADRPALAGHRWGGHVGELLPRRSHVGGGGRLRLGRAVGCEPSRTSPICSARSSPGAARRGSSRTAARRGPHADGGLERWDLAFADAARADPTAVACAVVRDGFNRDEWQRYVPALEYRETC